MAAEKLPQIVEDIKRQFPQVWDAYNQLGAAVGEAGPLDAKTARLVKLAIAVGANLQGAVHSHTKRGLSAGLSPQEMRQVALLGMTTVGWPRAVSALSWIEEELAKPR